MKLLVFYKPPQCCLKSVKCRPKRRKIVHAKMLSLTPTSAVGSYKLNAQFAVKSEAKLMGDVASEGVTISVTAQVPITGWKF